MPNIIFKGFPEETHQSLIERLISWAKKSNAPLSDVVYGFDKNEVKDLTGKFCPYVEIRVIESGLKKAKEIREIFCEMDTEILIVDFNPTKV